MRRMLCCLAFVCLSLVGASAHAQQQYFLMWNLEGENDPKCLYGEITVLVTHTTMYYCGASWHPAEPAGGYCGIQHINEDERRNIFSIWDTTPELRPVVTAADPKLIFRRFDGEGEGGHTHMTWPWKVGETFQFFVRKQPGAKPDTTACFYSVYDREAKAWRPIATIVSPNDGKESVATLGGRLNSFLENFSGKDLDVPKVALYRLWAGPSVDNLKCLTRAKGEGKWGEMNGAYFLAQGDDETKLADAIAKLEPKYGKAVFGEKDEKLPPIPNETLSPELIKALGNLPEAKAVANP